MQSIVDRRLEAQESERTERYYDLKTEVGKNAEMQISCDHLDYLWWAEVCFPSHPVISSNTILCSKTVKMATLGIDAVRFDVQTHYLLNLCSRVQKLE